MPVEPFVERPGDGSQIVDQSGRVRVERAEDEAAIGLDARQLGQVEPGVRHVAGIALGPRHARQRARVEVGPAVIRTLERLGRAGLPAAHGRAAMGAAVVERPDHPGRIAHHDDRPQAEGRAHEVVLRRYLALMRQIHPDRAENTGHLGAEDRFVGVDPAMDPILADQLVEIVPLEIRYRPGAAASPSSHAATIPPRRRPRRRLRFRRRRNTRPAPSR